MDEARSSCPRPTAEDTSPIRGGTPPSGAPGRRPAGERHPATRFAPPLRRGQSLPRHQRWPWIAEDLFDEDKW